MAKIVNLSFASFWPNESNRLSPMSFPHVLSGNPQTTRLDSR